MRLEAYKHVFTSVETHTVGEPTRIITSSFPAVSGSTMMERKIFLEQNCDHLRRALLCEPRGHKDMVGALILPKVHADADFGVVFMDAKRWVNMCGHASIGCAVYAVEAGLVSVCEPFTEVVMDTPSGQIRASVRVEHNKALEVTLHNVPSFLYDDAVKVTVDGKEYTAAISFGGTFFALFDAAQLSLHLDAKDIPFLVPFTKKLLDELNKEVQVKHPEQAIERVVNAEYYLTLGRHRQKNIVIAEEGQVDRSPCGTGTSAKLAYLHAKGKLSAQERFVNESFTGVSFSGMYKEETVIGKYRGIHPLITGRAYITGRAEYVIDEEDPLRYGFTIE